MKRAVLMAVAVTSPAFSASSSPSVIPLPARMTVAEGRFIIDSGFHITTPSRPDQRLTDAAKRFVLLLSRQTGIPMREAFTTRTRAAGLVVECGSAAPSYPTLGEDESYRLEVSAAGAKLSAPSTTGILRGFATFAQLVEAGPDGFFAPAVSIDDQPRFPWRGLMLDVSRHWMPMPVIERNLDAMAAVKMNVFHWHLSDDQGFRVENKRFPKLQQLGSDGYYYTQAEVHQLVDYARDRGIRVIPEFDIPGHATAWLAGYPELGSAPGPYAIERNWGIFKPTLDPTRETTYTFLEAFLGEMSALFPDPYFHIGGDEIDDTQWKTSPHIQAFMRAHGFQTSPDLHAYFNQRIQQILKKHGKTMIGWDEILHAGIQTDAVIQSWRGRESLADAARKGYRGILSNGYYLDHLDTAAFHYKNDPGDDPSGHILGGEACMWTEYVDPETVDSRIWPRAAAVAERLWALPDRQNVADFYARLLAVNRLLDWTGVKHRSNYIPMLDRLSAKHPEAPVRLIADAVEPLGIDIRQEARHYNSSTPLNRLVDAARPESERIRQLEQLALTDRQANQLRAAFTEWANNELASGPLPDSFLLAEVVEIAKHLAAAGSIGLQLLDQMESGKQVPENWISEQKQRLDKLEQPQAEVRLAAVRPVRALLEQLSRRSTASVSH